MALRKWLVLDWETVSMADLELVGTYRYAQDPTTDILCCVITNSGGRVLWHPGLPIPAIVFKAIAENWIWCAHNAAFEREIWRWIAVPEYGWPELPELDNWHDTMSRALQLALPGGLENVLRALSMKEQKDTEGSKLTIGLSKIDKKTGMLPVRTPEIMERVYTYCLSDGEGEVALVQRLGFLPECEREPWINCMEMNDRGIHLDMELVDAMQSVVDQAIPPLEREFATLTGGLRHTQRDKFIVWLELQGVFMANMQKVTVAEILEDAEADDSDAGEPDEWDWAGPPTFRQQLPPAARRALEIKQLIGSSSIAKLKTMDKVVCFDGRAHGTIVYHGTTPGRGTGRLLQPHNFPKPTLKVDGKGHDVETLVNLIKQRDPELLEMIYGVGAVETVVSGLRHTITAEPGARLLSGDYSGIQARVVLALAGQHDKTALLAAGLDAYIDMACDIWPELQRPDWQLKELVEAWKAQHPKERGIGKNSVLGLGFQMAALTFQIKYAKEHSLEFCQRVVDTYRKIWAPEVPHLWYDFQDAFYDTVWYKKPHEVRGFVFRLEDDWLTIEVPNGRGSKLWYKAPIPIRKPMKWDPTDIRRAARYRVQKQGVWISRDAYGGQITENVVMKIEREIMEDAKRRLKRYGYSVVLEVHDENVAELPYGRGSLDEYRRILEDVEPWTIALRIPIQVDMWEGPRYRK